MTNAATRDVGRLVIVPLALAFAVAIPVSFASPRYAFYVWAGGVVAGLVVGVMRMASAEKVPRALAEKLGPRDAAGEHDA